MVQVVPGRFKGLRNVSSRFQLYFRSVLGAKAITRDFKGISDVFQEDVPDISRMFQVSFLGRFNAFQGVTRG